MQIKDLIDTGDVEETKGSLNLPIGGLAYDSRQVEKGYLYFAIPGRSFDGHEFIDHAIERGAVAVVVERMVEVPSYATLLRVRSVRRTMGRWASLFHANPSQHMVLVGVTGTNGKTTSTYLLESIFFSAGLPCGVIGTIDYHYEGQRFHAPHTTPESVDLQALLAQMAREGVRSLAIEVSSHALTMERVRGVDFDCALFTNLSHDHLDFHGDMDSYFYAKSKLFTDYLQGSSKSKKFAIIHGDDPRGRKLIENVKTLGLEVISYGLSSEWDIHPLEYESDLDGLRGKFCIKDQELNLSSALIGDANLENILGAVGVGFALRLPMDKIAEGIVRMDSVPGRLQKIKNNFGITVVVDYAHTPDALEKVLQALRPLVRGRVITIFGCGGDRDRGKRPLMGEVAARLGDFIFLTSDNPRSEEPLGIIREIEEGVRKGGLDNLLTSIIESQNSLSGSQSLKPQSQKGYWIEPDRRISIRSALRLSQAGDLLLIAGKGHEDYQILGNKRSHFDDRVVVGEELAGMMV